MQLRKNDTIELAIHAISSDGNGVGRYNGMAVFVPHSAVGDHLLVQIVKLKKQFCYGVIRQILAPSPQRIPSNCPISQQCGGCQFRHLSYEAELEAKRGFVADALARIGGFSCIEVLPVLPSPQQNRYRNKVQYPVAPGADGGMVYGFYRPRSHDVIPCQNCLLQPEVLNQVAASAISVLQRFHVSPYNEETQKGVLRHLFLRIGVASGQVLLGLVCRRPLSNGPQIAAEIAAENPAVATVVQNLNPAPGNVILGRDTTLLYGGGVVQEEICGVPLQLDIHSFAQVNTAAARQIFQKVAQFAAPTPDATLLDLYCGAGVIALSMAQQCKRVIGVEIVPQAVKAARRSAQQMALGNTQFYCQDAGRAAAMLAAEATKPDIITVDPPRKGCSPDTLQAMLAMSPARIVMVSCNPATMARDIAMLCRGGYSIEAVQPADMFPRTKHVECIVSLIRQNTP